MINIEKERLEIPIYFSNRFDFESMIETFNQDLSELEEKFEIKNGEIEEKIQKRINNTQ